MGRRLELPAGVTRGPAVRFRLDGDEVTAFEGETVAAAIIALDGPQTRVTARGAPRGVFCGMGVCFDCLVVVDGVPNTRACMTWVRDGLDVRRQQGAGPAA
jgi:predicted molibdopterin-dependent oxidoreductase YjgC